MIYAGIGARDTPSDVLALMRRIGRDMAASGYLLRSGRARGADCAFEDGCGLGLKEIWTLANATPSRASWFKCAEANHPNWSACSPIAKQLHARNSPIILGENLDVPVDFVICWTLDGKASGGTGQALRIAKSHKPRIPVWNLQRPEHYSIWDKWCRL